MKTMTVRQSWSDDRIDGLELKVDEGFRHVDERFEQVDKRFEQVDKRFEQVDKRFEQMDKRFEQMDHRYERLEDRIERGFAELRAEMSARFEHSDGRFYAFQRATFAFYTSVILALVGVIVTQL